MGYWFGNSFICVCNRHYMESIMSTRSFGKVGKTYSSCDEAFKSADYATPIWRCETEWDRTKPLLTSILAFVFMGLFIYILCVGVTKWLSS
jgi:hypothetical protein